MSVQSRPMSSDSSSRLVRTTRRYWFGPAKAGEMYENPMIGRALTLLVDEFLEALAQGPDALLSVPDTAREHEAPVIQIIRALFVRPGAWRELLTELSESDGNARLKLAEMYAQWVVEVYDDQGAFDGRVHRIATAHDDKPLPPDV